MEEPDASHVMSDRLITRKSVSRLVLCSILKPARWWSREISVSLRKNGKREGEVHEGDQGEGELWQRPRLMSQRHIISMAAEKLIMTKLVFFR